MLCPYCLNPESKVVDKRDMEGITKRRRECLKCLRRYNTKEGVELPQVKVVKKNGVREDFNIEKVRRGIVKACEKRPISLEKIDKMIMRIENKARKKGKEVKSDFIGELVSNELKKMDNVAYIRFASVYRDFTDISDFKREIKELVRR